MKIFTVYDSKAKAYLQPFFSRTDATAVRDLKAAANTHDHQFNKYAEDYTLYVIGEFDEITGKISAHDPESIVNVLHLVDNLPLSNINPVEVKENEKA